MACSTDSDCQNGPPGTDFICACPGVAGPCTAPGGPCAGPATSEQWACGMGVNNAGPNNTCDPSVGRCVRQDCRDDVATFHEQSCQGSPNISQCNTDLDSCSLAGEECKILSCVDNNLGAITDGRVVMLGR
jgi:hypothetical protein